MKTEHTWYEAKTGNHQGLIICEKTGANIAVTYEKENAALIVRAVNSHDALVEQTEANASIASEECLRACGKETLISLICGIRNQAKAALKIAKGE